MQIQGIEKGSYYLVQVGESFETPSLAEIREIIEKGLKLRYKTFIFDMSECSHLDSSAIGVMVSLYRKCKTRGGKIGVLKPSSQMRQVLSFSNMDSLITIYDSEEEIQAGA